MGSVASAQERPAQLPPGAIVQPLDQDDGAELRRHLTTLAENPQSVTALVGAGRAALRMGDAEASLTFFGRANDMSPRDPRVRAGMGSALVQLGQPQAALILFEEAVGLGAPEIEIAADRGLAFDLTGDPRLAQQDYLMVLRQRDEPELRRRLALSLAISGRGDAAMSLINDQLRANDRAAWRVNAFILALAGDAAGANRIAQGMMPPASAQAMAPFFQRLRGLGPSHKAMAVHLGRFPSGGDMAGRAASDTSPHPEALALALGDTPAAAPAPVQLAQAQPAPTRRRVREQRDRGEIAAPRSPEGRSRRRTTTARRETERRPVQIAQTRPDTLPRAAAPTAANPPASAAPAPLAATPPPRQAPVQVAATAAPPSQPAPAPTVSSTPVQVASNAPAPARPTPRFAPPAQEPPASAAPSGLAALSERSAVQAGASPGFSLHPAGPQPQPATPPSGVPAFSEIATLVGTLPQEEAGRPAPAARPSASSAPAASPPPAQGAQARSAEPRPARARPAPPAHPSRHWVQIAGGANRAALPREFERLRTQAPEQLGRRPAYTTPLRATNRLLVGPFRNTREAQEFVNQLARSNIAAFAWTSEAGQEIERLQTRQ